MKCYKVNVHYDVVIEVPNIVAENEEDAISQAKEIAGIMEISDGEIVGDTACVTEEREMKNWPAKKSCPHCPRCGTRLIASDIPGYAYQCLNCDEDFYFCEVD